MKAPQFLAAALPLAIGLGGPAQAKDARPEPGATEDGVRHFCDVDTQHPSPGTNMRAVAATYNEALTNVRTPNNNEARSILAERTAETARIDMIVAWLNEDAKKADAVMHEVGTNVREGIAAGGVRKPDTGDIQTTRLNIAILDARADEMIRRLETMIEEDTEKQTLNVKLADQDPVAAEKVLTEWAFDTAGNASGWACGDGVRADYFEDHEFITFDLDGANPKPTGDWEVPGVEAQALQMDSLTASTDYDLESAKMLAELRALRTKHAKIVAMLKLLPAYAAANTAKNGPFTFTQDDMERFGYRDVTLPYTQ